MHFFTVPLICRLASWSVSKHKILSLVFRLRAAISTRILSSLRGFSALAEKEFFRWFAPRTWYEFHIENESFLILCDQSRQSKHRCVFTVHWPVEVTNLFGVLIRNTSFRWHKMVPWLSSRPSNAQNCNGCHFHVCNVFLCSYAGRLTSRIALSSDEFDRKVKNLTHLPTYESAPSTLYETIHDRYVNYFAFWSRLKERIHSLFLARISDEVSKC